ncbi:MAG: ABC transporter permease subunit [Treponema sp.]|jgi:ABC-2 type transport system permease protein|nr:ABC transporter permease subunit [Treponema sp.]
MNKAVFGDSFKRTAALARREIYSYCISPVFYGMGVFFLLFVNIWLFYFQHFFVQDMASFRSWFAAFPLAFIIVIPAITMKSWAEERRGGTLELLLTMPFSEWNLVLGKFTAALAVLAVFLLLTLPLPLSILPMGDFDGGILLGEYAGVLFLGAAAVSLGLFFSSISRNQAGAFLGGAVVLLITVLINQVPQVLNLPRFLADFINFFSLTFHFESFSRGILDSRDLAFFVLSTLLFLFLNTRVLIFRKWR